MTSSCSTSISACWSNVDQFHGIEIEEFPAQIAQVALWLMDHQMNLQAGEEFGLYFARLPLKKTPHIVHGNALRIDWNDVLPANRCSYVSWESAVRGREGQSDAQQRGHGRLCSPIRAVGVLDYRGVLVLSRQQSSCMADGNRGCVRLDQQHRCRASRSAFCGAGCFGAVDIRIHFAHRTFRWSNEARGEAAVHCVIIGFGLTLSRSPKRLLRVRRRRRRSARGHGHEHQPLPDRCAGHRAAEPLPPDLRRAGNGFGSMPRDGGQLILLARRKGAELLQASPGRALVRPLLGAEEFINGRARWCLWLGDAPPCELRAIPAVMERLEAVSQVPPREQQQRRELDAKTPGLFCQLAPPNRPAICCARVSSERRAVHPDGICWREGHRQ